MQFLISHFDQEPVAHRRGILELMKSIVMNHVGTTRVMSVGFEAHGKGGAAIFVAIFALCAGICATGRVMADDAGVVLMKAEAWAPQSKIAPKTTPGEKGAVTIEANGTRTCAGGWQYRFANVRGNQGYRIHAEAVCRDLPHPTDCLTAQVMWDNWGPTQTAPATRPMNFLLPTLRGPDTVEWDCCVKAPAGATNMTVRYTFRWSDQGSTRWTPPTIEAVAIPEPKPFKICVATVTKQTEQRIPMRRLSEGLGLPDDVAASVDLWGSLLWAACAEKPQLIVTPEEVISGRGLRDGAVTVPGPATRPFEEIARQNQVFIVLGLKQRDEHAVYNSAVLISPAGVQGVYHKVHFATGEDTSGLTPGDQFPVFSTPMGRLGCLICMDTMLPESSRMLALNGADIICLSIMGDLRADRFSSGQPIFNESRWQALMRTRAIDNQVCMAIARNDVQGSCIIDRKGEILAWNEGDREFIYATLPGDDGYRMWNGTELREVTFMLRRPHLYGPFTDPQDLGPLAPTEPPGGTVGGGR
jgi:predicted amidohydrolase